MDYDKILKAAEFFEKFSQMKTKQKTSIKDEINNKYKNIVFNILNSFINSLYKEKSLSPNVIDLMEIETFSNINLVVKNKKYSGKVSFAAIVHTQEDDNVNKKLGEKISNIINKKLSVNASKHIIKFLNDNESAETRAPIKKTYGLVSI